MHEQPPQVEAVDCVRVRVCALVLSHHVDGVGLGWRGDRTCITWRSDTGKHLGWAPAADIERR